ncbi:MAG: hypothetical protein NTV01_14675 [Bacteroidia bacterium]|nr:hypothetical protein [Bacteroidia bacterium]
MKKILLLLVVFLSFSLTNCDRSEKSELSNVTAASKLSDSPSLKGGKNKSDYQKAVDKSFGKLLTKLEKRVRDKKLDGGVTMAAAPVVDPAKPIPAEIIEEMTDADALELVDDLTPASENLLNSYGISTSSIANHGAIVFAAIIANEFEIAYNNGVQLEATGSTTISYYERPTNAPFGSVLTACLKSALGSLGVDFIKVASGGAILSGRAGLISALQAALGTAAKAIALEITAAWYAANILGCLWDHYVS